MSHNLIFPLSRNTIYKTAFSPPVSIEKTDKEYRIFLDIPGLDMNSVLVDVQNDTLCVRGEKKNPMNNTGSTYHRNEILSGPFSRTFTLPNDADRNDISAVYKQGYLCVTIKISPEKLPKTVKVIAED